MNCVRSESPRCQGVSAKRFVVGRPEHVCICANKLDQRYRLTGRAFANDSDTLAIPISWCVLEIVSEVQVMLSCNYHRTW